MRRTRVSIEVPDRGVAAARGAATLVGPVLGWDETTAATEIAGYDERVRAEVDSQRHVEDGPADSTRRAVNDMRQRTLAGART